MQASGRTQPTLCVVSPYAHDRTALVELLSDFGWSPLAVSTLNEAASVCRDDEPVIILDGDLPELSLPTNSEDLLTGLTPIAVVLVGDDRQDYAGVADAHVGKPVDAHRLAAIITDVVARRNGSDPRGSL